MPPSQVVPPLPGMVSPPGSIPSLPPSPGAAGLPGGPRAADADVPRPHHHRSPGRPRPSPSPSILAHHLRVVNPLPPNPQTTPLRHCGGEISSVILQQIHNMASLLTTKVHPWRQGLPFSSLRRCFLILRCLKMCVSKNSCFPKFSFIKF